MDEIAVQTLRKGEGSVVKSIGESVSMAKRLADMGFVRGARLQMIRPGNPCIVSLERTRMGLGIGYQANIAVRSEEGVGCEGESEQS